MKLKKLNFFAATAIAGLMAVSSAQADTMLMGYMNNEYWIKDLDDKNNTSGLDQHHINLMLQHETSIFKMFTELEFEHGVSMEDGVGQMTVERAYIESNFSPFFQMTFGRMMNVNLWQQNHYPNLVMPIVRPYLIKGVFNWQNNGFQFAGSTPFGVYYKVALDKSLSSNGGNSADGMNSIYKLGYRGMSGDMEYNLAGLMGSYALEINGYKAMGAEFSFKFAGFDLWVEWAKASGGQSNSGMYILPSYTISMGDNGDIAPYFLYDTKKANKDATESTTRMAFGLNYRPIPTLVTKFEFTTNKNAGETDSTKGAAIGMILFYN